MTATATATTIGEAAMILATDDADRVHLMSDWISVAETDETGRGWLDLYSDAACVGVGLEVEPHPGGKVWVVRTAPPLPA